MKKTKPAERIESALRQLLLAKHVGTHGDICEALQKQGFHVNQPKISRLLHQIGAIKIVDQEGQTSYRLPHEHGLMHEVSHPQGKLSVKQWVINIASNGTLIVIHTTPGAAQLVAREIDLRRTQLHVLGSIAGDDTIFIVPKNIKNIKQTIEEIQTIF